MNVWYAFLNALGIRMFEMDFMKNALLAVLLLGPLFGLLSTMIVTGKMSFFSDALGHSGFTGIAIGVLCGAVQPIYFAVGLSVLFALLFSFVRSRTSQSADTIIGVFPPPPLRSAFLSSRSAGGVLQNSTAISSVISCLFPHRRSACWRWFCWRSCCFGCSGQTGWCLRRCTRSWRPHAAWRRSAMKRSLPSQSPSL